MFSIWMTDICDSQIIDWCQQIYLTEEAERIGVDHVARMSTSETSEDSTGKYY
jgi:hypothetical protein